MLLSSLSLSWPLSSALVLLCAWIVYRYIPRRRLPFPPGPSPAPLIGNVHQVPVTQPEVGFTRWAATYGDVVYMKIFSSPMVILSSPQAVEDLLEKRSAIYSDRPRFVLLSELMGWQNSSTHVRYGSRFRKHRRFIHQTFNQEGARKLEPIQHKEAIVFLHGCLQTPQDYLSHIKRFAAATILKVGYGRDVTSIHDDYLVLSERAATLTIQSGTPAASIVDHIPILRYIPTWAPFSGFKRNASIVKEAVDDMMNIPFETVKRNMNNGVAEPCMVVDLLQSRQTRSQVQTNGDDEEIIKGVAGTLLAAAVDTTSAVIEAFILALVLHPEVLEKARHEMDSVIGKDTLPDASHRESLPYLECILKETYRWCCPVPLGIPHRLMKDDIYRGYHIPEGSTVMANIFAMLMDCPDPEMFIPERYLNDATLRDPRDYVFGFGRRRCPGRYFADTGVWLVMASIIATLDIRKAKDDYGNELAPNVEFIAGFVRHPKPYSCSITPRSPKTMELVHRAPAII